MVFAGANFGSVLKALASAIPPERPALVHGERIVSWGALDALTDRIAAGLAARGLQPGDIAGQMLRNTPDYILAYFGCAKAGVVPVNVNYHYKTRELADIFTRFGLKALFTESDFAETAREAMPEGTLTVDVGAQEWAALCDTPLPASHTARAAFSRLLVPRMLVSMKASGPLIDRSTWLSAAKLTTARGRCSASRRRRLAAGELDRRRPQRPRLAHHRQPALAAPHGAWHCGDAQRFRQPGSGPAPSRVAGLPGQRTDPRRLEAQADSQVDHDERGLPADGREQSTRDKD
mgnify:CR=1 FL=1